MEPDTYLIVCSYSSADAVHGNSGGLYYRLVGTNDEAAAVVEDLQQRCAGPIHVFVGRGLQETVQSRR